MVKIKTNKCKKEIGISTKSRQLEKIKATSGITLVALIITIIVLMPKLNKNKNNL